VRTHARTYRPDHILQREGELPPQRTTDRERREIEEIIKRKEINRTTPSRRAPMQGRGRKRRAPARMHLGCLATESATILTLTAATVQTNPPSTSLQAPLTGATVQANPPFHMAPNLPQPTRYSSHGMRSPIFSPPLIGSGSVLASQPFWTDR
jgi:hypothetical protein